MSAESAESLLFRAHDVSHHSQSSENGTFFNYDLFRGSVRRNASSCVSGLVEIRSAPRTHALHDGGFEPLAAFRCPFSHFYDFPGVLPTTS